jgi:hypothetical protein
MPVGFAGILFLLSVSGSAQRGAAPPAAAPGPPACPGAVMDVQATGTYTQRPVPDIVINGQPAPGAIWAAGERSYWHCHAGGQIMMLDQGEGRVQKRGERIRILRRGDTEWAGPGVEHWHGAGPDSTGHYFQTIVGAAGTYWMEEVGHADYMGNDVGITSRNEFLRTGTRKKDPTLMAPGGR